MTKFEKEMFTWDGMYLMYKGDFAGAQMMMDVCPDAHPSWEGKLKPAFVARFKYRKPYKTWIKFLCKHATVEEYMDIAWKTSPMDAMKHFGYEGA